MHRADGGRAGIQRGGGPVGAAVFGCVTTGEAWQFLRLSGSRGRVGRAARSTWQTWRACWGRCVAVVAEVKELAERAPLACDFYFYQRVRRTLPSRAMNAACSGLARPCRARKEPGSGRSERSHFLGGDQKQVPDGPRVVHGEPEAARPSLVPYDQLEAKVDVGMRGIAEVFVIVGVVFQFRPKLVEQANEGGSAQAEGPDGAADLQAATR